MLNSESKIREYKIVVELKVGSQGFVYLVKNEKNNEQCVVKTTHVEESKKADFEKMVETWILLNKSEGKDFIVKYKEHFVEGKNTIIVMEFCSGGDLDTLIKRRFTEKNRFTEQEVLKVLIEVMSALKEMKILKFIHRDVKSANILIGSDGKYKMSDFNTSRVFEGSGGASTLTGTLEYAAAEIAKSEDYSYEVDVWSLGVVLYQMVAGKTPFVNARGLNMLNLIMGKYEPLTTALGYSQDLVDVIHGCLSLNPKMRPTPEGVLDSSLVTKTRIADLERRVAKAQEEAKEAKEEAKEAKERAEKAERKAEDAKREVAEMRTLLVQLRKDVSALQTRAAENVLSSFQPAHTPVPGPAPKPVSGVRSVGATNDYFEIINNWIGGSKSIRYPCLYKATVDGFTGKSFHAKCDHKGPTVTIITSSEGWMFGGYAAVSWDNRHGSIGDPSNQSFVFSLINPHKLSPTKFAFDCTKVYKALYGHPEWGPRFSSKFGIHCVSKSNENEENFTQLDDSAYSNTTGLKGDVIFTGKEYFKAKEIEVYQVY